MLLPLETQHAIRHLAASCTESRPFVRSGSLLTVWAILEEGGSPHLLEPLAARRLDRSLAVEPIELVAERQSAGDDDDQPLRYGEGFRLRAAGCSSLYLGHTSAGASGGLQWAATPTAPAGGARGQEAPKAPRGTRFAAHGGELGCPLLLGRPLSLQRVRSPSPPTPEDSDDASESDASDASMDSGRRRARRATARSRRKAEAQAATSAAALEAAAASATPLLPEAGRYASEGLFSRVADVVGGIFPATLLPLLDSPAECD